MRIFRTLLICILLSSAESVTNYTIAKRNQFIFYMVSKNYFWTFFRTIQNINNNKK